MKNKEEKEEKDIKGKIIFRYEGPYSIDVRNSIVESYKEKQVHIWCSVWEANNSMLIQINELKDGA